ncbi:MOP flippase family protein [Thiomicrorhabdus arctica]|jgi:PST family polysaccharide transporter|uniref:MOP flippase family protein n=1 Tax=Thiomicrorhabdus arctica TaxID=131540 RepID=UPI0003618D90|nr:MOP flippase family protein [Thiomicrorhabdus arctica]
MSLKDKAVNGVAWNGIGNIARQILLITTLVVLARLLTPEDFGVYAILMIFVTFMNIFASMGTSQAVIHLDSPDKRMLSSIFYFNVSAGIFLFLALFFLAWPIAYFFENPALINLLQIVGLSFVITTLSMVQKALFEKQMAFKIVIIIETFALTISSIAGIVSALNNAGIYSLIIMTLSNSLLLTIGLWYASKWKPSFLFAWQDIKTIWSYSLHLTGHSIVNHFARQSDQILIGKFIGAGALGMYSMAYKIMLYPLENISRVIVRVLFPALSEIKDDNARFKAGYLKAISYVALFTFPLMIGLMAVAPDFVLVAFGDKWEGMAVLLMILAPVGLMQSIITTTGSIYMAKGSTGVMFKIGAINSAVTVVAFLIGIPFGVQGVAIAYVIANIVMLYPNLHLAWQQIDLKVTEAALELLPFFNAALFMGIATYALSVVFENIELYLWLKLLLEVLSGAAIYVGILMLFYRSLLLNMISKLKRNRT